MMFRVVHLAVVALIAICAQPSYAASIGYPEELVEEPVYDFVPQVRERRSPQFALSGGGSDKAGTVRLDGSTNVWSNGKTGVDANGFAQRSWQQGYPAQNSFGAGAAVSHNLYKGKRGELDVFAGYQRQWNTGSDHSYNAGLRYRF